MIGFKYIFSRLTNYINSGSGIDDPGIEAASRKNPSSHYAAVNGTRNSRDSSGSFIYFHKIVNNKVNFIELECVYLDIFILMRT